MTKDLLWRFFVRTGNSGPYELYRLPTGVMSLDAGDRFKHMERLTRDGAWLSDNNDNALASEWASGWFLFEEDEISEGDAVNLTDAWLRPGAVWPGR